MRPNQQSDLPERITKPLIIVDIHEKQPLRFKTLCCVRRKLPTGDLSVLGATHLFAVERKTVRDFLACCADRDRKRFEAQLQRLQGYRFARLLIIGTESELSKKARRFLSVLEMRYDVPVVWALNAEAAAVQVERWAFFFANEVLWATRRLLNARVESLEVIKPKEPGAENISLRQMNSFRIPERAAA